MKITALLKTALLLCAIAHAGVVHAATVSVFAAASLTDSLKRIAAQYQATSGDKIEFNFAASSVLERQIEEGAPADIFFSADEAKMDTLEKKGLIEPKSRHSRLSNSLVIIVSADNAVEVHGAADLSSPTITHLALGDPRAVPAGIYAKEYLQKIQLWDKVSAKVVPMANVREALAAVESGNAEAGIVYKTDAAISRKVKIACEIPRNEGPKISYPVAIVKQTLENPAAGKFLDFLNSPEAGKIFENSGFIVETVKP